jgi:hypothetical protein
MRNISPSFRPLLPRFRLEDRGGAATTTKQPTSQCWLLNCTTPVNSTIRQFVQQLLLLIADDPVDSALGDFVLMPSARHLAQSKRLDATVKRVELPNLSGSILGMGLRFVDDLGVEIGIIPL